MAKKSVTVQAAEIAEKLAQTMGYEFVDAELAREHGAAFLRIYVDREGGMDLDACEKFHHALIKEVEELDYDYLEVSSPGVDRPLKRDRDFEKAAGETVEVHLYKQTDGQKLFIGTLVGLIEDKIVIATGQGQREFLRKEVSKVAPVIEYEDIEEDET